MRYMFRVLVLGDPGLSIPFVKKGGLNHVSEDFELSRWSKTLKVGYDDRCDLEIDVVTSSSSDFDSLIPTSDGIIYFLNPNKIEDFELFDMISSVILEVRREIPIIVIFNNNDGIIKIPSNALLEYIWNKYPFEAFIFDKYSKNTLYEVLECLSDAIISGSMPINIETAWMRIPFFIKKINKLVENENWSRAARLSEIYTQIRKKFEKQDYYISAEQASWLYYKTGDFLNASAMLESGVNIFDAKKFKEFYVNDLIHQGDRLFKVRRFRSSAEKYEKAALWSSIELNNVKIYESAINYAINTWISACEFQNAFKLIDKLDHNDQLNRMKEISPQIVSATDFLIQQKNYEIAKGQLYFSIDKYQRAGLFEEVKILAGKIIGLLKILIKNQIQQNKPENAILTLDELLNIWETFEIDHDNLDDTIYSISALFLKKNNFSIIDKLMLKVESIEVQRQISELRVKSEEDYKISLDSAANADFLGSVSILESYVKEENIQFQNIVSNQISFSHGLIEEKQNWDAIMLLKNQASWFKNIGHLEFSNQIYKEILKIYLTSEKPYLIQFFKDITILPSSNRTKFLKNNQKSVLKALERACLASTSYDRTKALLENAIRLFRNHLLYEDSKDMVRLLVNYIKGKATELLFSTKDLSNVDNVLSMLKNAELIYAELGEKLTLKADKTREEIVKRLIISGQLSRAQIINEKIRDKSIYSTLHNSIQQLESEKSEAQIKDVQKILNWKIKSEQLSMLKNHSRDILINQQSNLKKRTALKRVLYKDMLGALNEKNYDEALNVTSKAIKSLIKQKKFESASTSAAIAGLILIKLEKTEKIKQYIKDFDEILGLSSNIFHETFPMKVLDYAAEMFEFNERKRALEAIALYENLALFPEEILLLNTLLREIDPSRSQIRSEDSKINVKNQSLDAESRISAVDESINEGLIDSLIKKLDVKNKLFTRRKMMKRKYWDNALKLLGNQSYSDAASEYFGQVKNLEINNHNEYNSIANIMGIVSLIKINMISEAKRSLDKITIKSGSVHDNLTKNPEYILLDHLIAAYNNQNLLIIGKIIEGYILNLPLFEEEKSLMMTLSSKDVATRVAESTQKQKTMQSQNTLLLNQQLGNLKQSLGDIQSVSQKMITKRNAMKRIYYNDILDNLETNDYSAASNLYKSVATRISQRNDYDMAGILILLGGLSLFKCETNSKHVKEYMNGFLDNLGFTKKVIDETFGIKLLKFLIEADLIKDESLMSQGWQMLNVLPIFDQEKRLIEK